MANTLATQKKVFDATSPGFLYSIVVAALTAFAASGVHFPGSPEDIAGAITTTLSQYGVYSVIGIIAISVIAPIVNFFKSGQKFSFHALFGSVLFWIALANVVLSLLALNGLSFPDGAIEGAIRAISVKDWAALGGLLTSSILPTLIRWIKSKK